jgi:ATP-dependent DNA helicase RecG
MVDNQARPTYAALLLFGQHPQQWIPSASMIAARFPGTSFSDEFVKQEIRGTLSEQLRQAETFVRDHMRAITRLVGLTRQETPEYPLEAVRELLVNAVAHRDYSQQGDTIHLHIFADRLEVHSPGGLPGPVTLSNLLESRFSRNAVIAQVLSDLGFVERLGYGLNRVMTAVKQNNLPAPKFEELGGAFRVTLFSKSAEKQRSALPDLSIYAEYDLNPRQQRALGYLVENNRITNSDYLALCPEVSAETVRRDLVDFVKKGILIKVGDKRATYYILKK